MLLTKSMSTPNRDMMLDKIFTDLPDMQAIEQIFLSPVMNLMFVIDE